MKKLAITYIIILIILAILPINGTSSTLNNNYTFNIRWDYLVHALVYIPILPLLLFKVSQTKPKPKPQSKYLNLSFALLPAISLEAVQYIIPWRTFNINDMFSNVLGVGIGFVLMKIIKF